MTPHDTDPVLCVTCGYWKTPQEFKKGCCTCKQCQDEGRGSVNYDLDEDGNVVVVE